MQEYQPPQNFAPAGDIVIPPPAELPFDLDSTPTENSNNAVRSGGIFTALEGKEDALPECADPQDEYVLDGTKNWRILSTWVQQLIDQALENGIGEVSWEDIAGKPDFLLEESDPTVPDFVKSLTEEQIEALQWLTENFPRTGLTPGSVLVVGADGDSLTPKPLGELLAVFFPGLSAYLSGIVSAPTSLTLKQVINDVKATWTDIERKSGSYQVEARTKADTGDWSAWVLINQVEYFTLDHVWDSPNIASGTKNVGIRLRYVTPENMASAWISAQIAYDNDDAVVEETTYEIVPLSGRWYLPQNEVLPETQYEIVPGSGRWYNSVVSGLAIQDVSATTAIVAGNSVPVLDFFIYLNNTLVETSGDPYEYSVDGENWFQIMLKNTGKHTTVNTGAAFTFGQNVAFRIRRKDDHSVVSNTVNINTSGEVSGIDWTNTYLCDNILYIMEYTAFATQAVMDRLTENKDLGFDANISFSFFKVAQGINNTYSSYSLAAVTFDDTEIRKILNHAKSLGIKITATLHADIKEYTLDNMTSTPQTTYKAGWKTYCLVNSSNNILGLDPGQLTSPPMLLYLKFVDWFTETFKSFEDNTIIAISHGLNNNQESEYHYDNTLTYPNYAAYQDRTAKMKAFYDAFNTNANGWKNILGHVGSVSMMADKRITLAFRYFAAACKGLKVNHGSDWTANGFHFNDALLATWVTEVANKIFCVEYFRSDNVDSAANMAQAIVKSLDMGASIITVVADNVYSDGVLVKDRVAFKRDLKTALVAAGRFKPKRITPNFAGTPITVTVASALSTGVYTPSGDTGVVYNAWKTQKNAQSGVSPKVGFTYSTEDEGTGTPEPIGYYMVRRLTDMDDFLDLQVYKGPDGRPYLKDNGGTRGRQKIKYQVMGADVPSTSQPFALDEYLAPLNQWFFVRKRGCNDFKLWWSNTNNNTESGVMIYIKPNY